MVVFNCPQVVIIVLVVELVVEASLGKERAAMVVVALIDLALEAVVMTIAVINDPLSGLEVVTGAMMMLIAGEIVVGIEDAAATGWVLVLGEARVVAVALVHMNVRIGREEEIETGIEGMMTGRETEVLGCELLMTEKHHQLVRGKIEFGRSLLGENPHTGT